MMAELLVPRLRATLAEEIDRQTREDDARGPEPEQSVVTRTVFSADPGWIERELVARVGGAL
ncbi:hypothetical protein AB0G29_35055 [Streptomyces parvus]|uniref:hypothetical protein n=1 Tax=Streptomyces parvus TaxID=66428 RepID=UPI0033D1546F